MHVVDALQSNSTPPISKPCSCCLEIAWYCVERQTSECVICYVLYVIHLPCITARIIGTAIVMLASIRRSMTDVHTARLPMTTCIVQAGPAARWQCRCQPTATGLVDARGVELRSYLEMEAGMKPYQADRLLRELGNRQHADLPWLQSRIAELAAVFGPENGHVVSAAIYNGGLDLLDRDAAGFKGQLAGLKEVLAGVNVLEIVSREPRLLYTPNVAAASKKVITKLTAIYPYKVPNKKQAVIALVAEYPELLVRMQHYSDNKDIKKVQDLPVDLQNRILKSYC